MKFSTLPLLALLAVPALAQEPDERWQVGLGLNLYNSDSAHLGGDGYSARIHREGKAAPSLHVGYRVWDFADSNLSVTGEYQIKTNFHTKTTAAVAGGRPFNVSNVAKMQYFAPGIQWNFHKVVDCGVGLQYRFMRQDAKVAGSGYQTYNNYRPWLNAYVGHTFRKGEGMLRPYVALRVATMLGTTKAPGKISDVTKSQGGRDSLARSLAPTYEATLMGGVRF